MGANPKSGIDVYLHFSVCVLSCVGKGPATSSSPLSRSPTKYPYIRFRNPGAIQEEEEEEEEE
jgi:hypothetical protein